MIEREYSSFTSRVRVPRPPIRLSLLQAEIDADKAKKNAQKKIRPSSKSKKKTSVST